VEKIIEFVKNELSFDHSGHDFNHAKRVLNNALKIMKTLPGNKRVITAACLLHDTIDEKLFIDSLLQEQKIKKVLTDSSFNESEIDEILFIIKNISFHKGIKSNNINFMIVQDADRLDALGAIGIIRTIEYGSSKKRSFYEEENLKKENDKITFNKSTNTTLSHFYDKLLKLGDLMNTQEAKLLAKKRMEFINNFLDNFYEELE